METVGLDHYLILGAILFVCGAICMATKRNAIGVLIGVELVLNGANINFVAFASGPTPSPIPAYVATAAIGLACVLSMTGFIQYAGVFAEHESRELALEDKVEHLRDKQFHTPKTDTKAQAALKAEIDTQTEEL